MRAGGAVSFLTLLALLLAVDCTHDYDSLGGNQGGGGASACSPGAETCACAAGNTCQLGLTCASNHCVKVTGKGGTTGATGGTIAGGAGAGGTVAGTGGTSSTGGQGAGTGSGGTGTGGSGAGGASSTGGKGDGGTASGAGGLATGGMGGSSRGGTGGASCPAGSSLCADGACSSNNDAIHCGSSCTACGGGAICTSGACGCAASTERYCAATCVDITTVANCGSCGNKCGSGQSCVSGGCMGGTGTGGAGGPANCVDAVKRDGYGFSGVSPCSACVEQQIDRSAQCEAMIDCLDANYPCSTNNNCELDCANSSGADGYVMSCADTLVSASCSAGTGGSSGTGGSGGAGPCAGLCSNPTTVAPQTNSGDLGTGATCQEIVGASLTGLTCGNFASPRTFTVNGVSVNCVSGGIFSLPVERNGGYCMQASAGDFSYAFFTTY